MTDSVPALLSRQIDGTIESALAAISHALQTSPEEALAAQADVLAAAEKLWEWVDEQVTTVDGVQLTRDEFRRRLESERARHAGEAERLRLNESCAELERLVLGRSFSPSLEGAMESPPISAY